jgi:hypothetical protein
MKKTLFIIYCSCFIAGSIVAQSIELQLFGVSNGTASDADLQLEWSIGESFITAHQTDFGLLTEGFIQPEVSDEDLFIETNLETTILPSQFSIEVFPNPVYDLFTLKLNQPIEALGYISILDMTGKVLYHDAMPLGTQQQELDLNNYPSGLYLVRYISPQLKFSKSVKILKVQYR